jgi:hypothetical protein
MKFARARPAILATAALCLTGGAIAIGLGACGGGSPPAPVCPNDVPDTCPSPAPSFAVDVAPIIQNRCAACHVPGGMEPGIPFQTYAQIVSEVKPDDTMLFEINDCIMPPIDYPQLLLSEREILLTWLICGAADN